jgi:hypothetical protein
MNELLKNIIAFQDINGRLYDLNFSQPSPEVPDLLKAFENKNSYKKIAQHYSGSLICFYDASGSWSSDEYIVYWIDANGEPNLPIAISLKQFLSILPYGTGIMFDVLYLIIMPIMIFLLILFPVMELNWLKTRLQLLKLQIKFK